MDGMQLFPLLRALDGDLALLRNVYRLGLRLLWFFIWIQLEGLLKDVLGVHLAGRRLVAVTDWQLVTADGLELLVVLVICWLDVVVFLAVERK